VLVINPEVVMSPIESITAWPADPK